jgi:hypothetical protein
MDVKETYAIIAKVGAAQVLTFGDISVLRGKRITGILVPQAGANAPDGTVGYTGAMKDVYLNLLDDQKRAFLDGVNLVEFQRSLNGGLLFPVNTNKTDWTKSHLFFGDDAVRAANVGKAITLTICYE